MEPLSQQTLNTVGLLATPGQTLIGTIRYLGTGTAGLNLNFTEFKSSTQLEG